jgi:hypothetical protein
MRTFGKPKFFKKIPKTALENFSSNTCLIILGALSVIKISTLSDLPSLSSEIVKKEGGVPLNYNDISSFITAAYSRWCRHLLFNCLRIGDDSQNIRRYGDENYIKLMTRCLIKLFSTTANEGKTPTDESLSSWDYVRHVDPSEVWKTPKG